MSDGRHEAMEREVSELVREYASRFPEASMSGPTPHPPAGMRLELWSTRPGTAKVVLYPSDDDEDVWVGEATGIDLPARKRDRGTRVQEVRAILEAVVDGRFEETIWEWRGKTIKSLSVLYRHDGRVLYRVRHYSGLPVLAITWGGRTKRHITYSSYHPERAGQ